jgi:hypothetical protein
MRPLVHRAVPRQLEVVAVGVGEVHGLVGAVIGELAQRDARRLQPAHGVGEPRPGRIVERDVVEARHAVGLRAAAGGLPGVEPQVVVIAAGRDEQDVARRAPAGDVARLGDDVEAEHADVEVAHPVDVGGAQVDVADAHAGIDRVRCGLDRFDVALGHEPDGTPSASVRPPAARRRCTSSPPVWHGRPQPPDRRHPSG